MIKDRLKVMKARAQRQQQALQQLEHDIDDALSHLDLVVNDIGDPRQRLTTQPQPPDTADDQEDS